VKGVAQSIPAGISGMLPNQDSPKLVFVWAEQFTFAETSVVTAASSEEVPVDDCTQSVAATTFLPILMPGIALV